MKGCRIHPVAGATLASLQACYHLISSIMLQNRYYNDHFKDEDTEA